MVYETFSSQEIWTCCRETLVKCAGNAGETGLELAFPHHKLLIND